ncbi:MAG: hypothetical protein Q9159_004786 [Coniocarpon cinnabarinum]
MACVTQAPTPDASDNNPSPRFKQPGLCVPSEWREKYKPGGFHPIDLGDTLNGGRYKIVRKLGYGSFSTVWLAQDQRTTEQKYAAIKVGAATANDEFNYELSTYTRVQQPLGTGEYTSGTRLVKLIDDFVEEGVNGKHQCLVFDVMGPPLSSLLRYPAEYKGMSVQARKDRRLPLWLAKRAVKCLVYGAHELHTHGIAHGDLHPGNVLLRVQDLCQVRQEELMQTVTNDKMDYEKLERLDGKSDSSAPEYLVRSLSLNDWVDFSSEGMGVKIGDVGGAFPFSKPPVEIETPAGFRCPETVLNLKIDEKIDIWSLGCLIFEVFTQSASLSSCFRYSHVDRSSSRKALFMIDPFFEVGSEDFIDDCMINYVDRLGPLPDFIAKRWDNRDYYYDAEWTKIRTNVEPDEDEEEAEGEELLLHESLEEDFMKAKSPEMGNDEAEQIITLLKSLLRYHASERLSTSQILENPWVSSLSTSQ